LPSWSCKYTTPPRTTGGAVSAPRLWTPAAAVPVSLNAHASRSPDTFAAEITASGAFLVLARSPFGSGHDPDGAAAPANAVLTGAGLPLLHAAASTVTDTTTASPAPARARLPSFAVISAHPV
jgi:hypothetical protein